ncbi:hypothetical protein FsymDg_1503 [Candidatus Protofrankia datiscae]|uniref:Uncharacterized protein n=1 Tax=Candidatus Protofrankia datiscae TaxID=2716812 RepID=F8B2Y0_9ACTN|nr:hypothetical protein FsymDg_1503 [Candidatus Protofrankia datiscae]
MQRRMSPRQIPTQPSFRLAGTIDVIQSETVVKTSSVAGFAPVTSDYRRMPIGDRSAETTTDIAGGSRMGIESKRRDVETRSRENNHLQNST